MKRIIIGTLVATVIYFAYQSAMWVGGFHNDISVYTPQQDSILADIVKHNLKEDLYMLPYYDYTAKDAMKNHEAAMKAHVGKPWAMVFYHPEMEGESAGTILKGAMHTLIACLLAALIVFAGGFNSFGKRFLVAMAFGLFALVLGPMQELNWWSMPWGFVKAQVIDLTLGWGITSLWLAFFVKKTT